MKRQPNGRPGNDYGQPGKDGPEYAFHGMVAIGGRSINPNIGVMNEMEFPHPFHLVLYPVNEPGTHKVKDHEAREHKQPKGKVHDMQ